MNCAAFCASSLNSTPRAFARIPTGYPWIDAHPVASDPPYSGLNSSNTDPSTTRAITSRGSNGIFRSPGTIPSNSSASNNGSSYCVAGGGPSFFQFSRETICRPSRIASRSSTAK